MNSISTFYSLGVNNAKLSGDLLKDEIISHDTPQPGKRKQGPLVITLSFAAATYLASILTTSSHSDTNSESEESKKGDQGNEGKESEEIKELEELSDFCKPVPAINQMVSQAVKVMLVFFLIGVAYLILIKLLITDIDEPVLWTDDMSNSVNLTIRCIHQLTNQGINPLRISADSVVAAQPNFNSLKSGALQEYATPLPDGHPAGPDQIITVISWSDTLQMHLKIGEQYLFCVKVNQKQYQYLSQPELEDKIQDKEPMPWAIGVLIALVAQSDDLSLDPTLKNLKFGQWWTMQTIKDYLMVRGTRQSSYKGNLLIDEKAFTVVAKKITNVEGRNEDTYLTELAVYLLTSCLLEHFKIAMFFLIHVTDDQKWLLNTLQIVFNMVLRDEPSKLYHIEEVLNHPLEVIYITQAFSPAQPKSISSDCLSAFVHFTYDYFQGQALVSNIKFKDGSLTGMCMIDHKHVFNFILHKWSWDNPGQGGLDAFISSHICRTACFALDLNPASFKYDKTDKKNLSEHNDFEATPEDGRSNIQNKESRSGTSQLEEEAGVIDHEDDGEN
ncbi:uncharacterized protein MELLADRAFT_60191 [Melampsora larici-populina 98AG31]|uniref:Alpha-type protein kinase domain-containing protein n=1 Tax=Melampsora larici-populina (strain 98AG31 / pathotype 3-4-7) TaxID=747676 RepID=F4RAE8_MELLP|nr:uncharacterized protein MELLADRAFT_60191 [Melampsora larici-populina 98AG31]EGG10467.1 hypothetical protein MELLADRAFT_60191 [Melampsora larici-populina 98AG31]